MGWLEKGHHEISVRMEKRQLGKKKEEKSSKIERRK